MQLAIESADAYGEAPINPAGAVDALLGAAGRILEFLPVQDDDDAAGRALALVAGSISVVDALDMVAISTPSAPPSDCSA